MSCGLDGRGSIPGKGKIYFFSIKHRPALGPTQTPVNWILGVISQGIKLQGCEIDHSPPPTVRSKMVELYLYSRNNFNFFKIIYMSFDYLSQIGEQPKNKP
jgi:hypothetical protein